MLKRRPERSRLLASAEVVSRRPPGTCSTLPRPAEQDAYVRRPVAPPGHSHKAVMKMKIMTKVKVKVKVKMKQKCTRSAHLIAVILASIGLSLLQVTRAYLMQESASSVGGNSSQQRNPLETGNQTSGEGGGEQKGATTQLGMAEQNPDASDTVPVYMQHTTTVLVTLHLSVFVSGLVGNSLVCLSVYRNKSLQTITNYYIVNLAVADFLVILICLPPTVYWDLTLTWNFGLVLCKLVPYLQSISVSVSVLTLTCISIDRWYAICRPLKFCSTKSRAKATIGLIWLVSALIASPDVIFLTTRPVFEENGYVYMDCIHSWPESATKIYQLCIVALLFVLPFVLMIISYSQIVNVLWRNETMAESMQNSFDAINKIKAAQEAEAAREQAECDEQRKCRQDKQGDEEVEDDVDDDEANDDSDNCKLATDDNKRHLALKWAIDKPDTTDRGGKSRPQAGACQVKWRLLSLSAAAAQLMHFLLRNGAGKHKPGPIGCTYSKCALADRDKKRNWFKSCWHKQLFGDRCRSLKLAAAKPSLMETSRTGKLIVNCAVPNGVGGDNLHGGRHASKSSSSMIVERIDETIEAPAAKSSEDDAVVVVVDIGQRRLGCGSSDKICAVEQSQIKDDLGCCAPSLSQSLDNRNEVIVSSCPPACINRKQQKQQLATDRLSLTSQQATTVGGGGGGGNRVRRRHKPPRRCPHELPNWNDGQASSFKVAARSGRPNVPRGTCLQRDGSAAASSSNAATATVEAPDSSDKQVAATKLHLLLELPSRRKDHSCRCGRNRHQHRQHHKHSHRQQQLHCNQDGQRDERHGQRHRQVCQHYRSLQSDQSSLLAVHKQRQDHRHCSPPAAAAAALTRAVKRLSGDHHVCQAWTSKACAHDNRPHVHSVGGPGKFCDNSHVGDGRAGEIVAEQPLLYHHHHHHHHHKPHQCGASGGGSHCTVTILMFARDQVKSPPNGPQIRDKEDTVVVVDDTKQQRQVFDLEVADGGDSSGTQLLPRCKSSGVCLPSSSRVAKSGLVAAPGQCRRQDSRSTISPTRPVTRPESHHHHHLTEWRPAPRGRRGLALGRLVAIEVLQRRPVPERPIIGANSSKSSSRVSASTRTSWPTSQLERLAPLDSLAASVGANLGGSASSNNLDAGNKSSTDNQVVARPSRGVASSFSEPSLIVGGADVDDGEQAAAAAAGGRQDELGGIDCVRGRASAACASESSGQLMQNSCGRQYKGKFKLKSLTRQGCKSVESLALIACDRSAQSGNCWLATKRHAPDARPYRPTEDSSGLPINRGTGRSGPAAHCADRAAGDDASSGNDHYGGDDCNGDADDDDDAIATVAVRIRATSRPGQVRARAGKLVNPDAAAASGWQQSSSRGDAWRPFAPGAPAPASSSSTSNNNKRFCKLIESRKKAAKMLIVIVIMFGLCYLPVHFLNTLRVTIGLPQNDITTIASLVSHWLCYFNSAVNPLIYNLMSGKFRHEFANLFFCRCFRRSTAAGAATLTSAPSIVVIPSAGTAS